MARRKFLDLSAGGDDDSADDRSTVQTSMARVRPEEGVWGRRCPPPPRVHRLSVVRHGANEGASLSEAATFGWSPGHSGACHNRDEAQRQRWRRQRRGDAAAVQILALSPLQ
jgi:hypothetical protein